MIDFTFQLFIKLENFSVCCFVNFLMISCDNKIVCRTLFLLVDYVLPSYLFPHLQIRYISSRSLHPTKESGLGQYYQCVTSCAPRDHVPVCQRRVQVGGQQGGLERPRGGWGECAHAEPGNTGLWLAPDWSRDLNTNIWLVGRSRPGQRRRPGPGTRRPMRTVRRRSWSGTSGSPGVTPSSSHEGDSSKL